MTRASAELVQDGAKPSLVATGFGFTEGPVWFAEIGSLVFSDIRGNAMHRVGADGQVSEYRAPSNFANGSTRDSLGRLITCEHGTSRVVREESDGSLTVLAAHWRGNALNSPNDVISDSCGAVWFTDPIYGRMKDYGVEREQELSFQGVFRHSPDGSLDLVADDFDQPNGLCLTADEQTLLVSDTRRFHIRRFSVAADGAVSGGEVFAETRGHETGCPDGLKIDSLNRVFSCGPGGIQVFSEAGGFLDTLAFPEEVTNFTWGGPDLRTLFATAQTSIYALRLAHPGRALPTFSAKP